ncbi:MAG: lipid II flippase MurJ [Myxococcota bacterium]
MTESARPRRGSFGRAFASSALGTGLSRGLGAAREIAVAAILGASITSDVFLTAFLIPNLFRRFVADEGLTGALLPALAKAEAEGGEEEARQLAASTLGVLLVVNGILCVMGMVGAKWLVLVFAPTWHDDPVKMALAIDLTRWLFPFLTMVSLVSHFEALLNHRGHFFVPKAAPGLVSGGMVASALLLGDVLNEPVYALVAGVLVGGVAHVLVHLPFVWSHWGPIGLSLP